MNKPKKSEEGLVERLTALQNRLEDAKLKYSAYKYERAQDIAGIGLDLANEPDEWKAFCKMRFWQKHNLGNSPQSHKLSDAIHFSFVYAYAKIAVGRDMPSLHCRAVKAILAEGVPRDQIAAEIKKRGGFTGAVGKTQSNDVNNYGNDKKGASPKINNHNKKTTSSTSVKRLPVDLDTQLVVNLPKIKLQKVCRLSVGDTFWVLCEHKGEDDHGIIAFDGVEVDDL